ncbi:ketoacyl-ACP synthase III family protein (plasmid) [Streptomyces sp. BI20]|uniref:ketoacyl-ACP synthase III family protein n=1 Tax=Streptomyces sp. BI20 TaxID=3403460 RepID=UPI003C71D6A1
MIPTPSLHLAATGSWFPATRPVHEAVTRGALPAPWAATTGLRRVAICEPEHGPIAPEMAREAGRLAVERAGRAHASYRRLLFVTTGFSGAEGWNAAAYLQNEVLDGHGGAYEVRQLSNGALTAIEAGDAWLAKAPPSSCVLVVAADRFSPPVWDRWRANRGFVFADGAAAVVLANDTGFARVESIVSVSDTTLEAMQRGSNPLLTWSDPADHPVRLYDRSQEFFDVMPPEEIRKRLQEGLIEACTRAAAEAGCSLSSVDHLVFPNFGRSLLREQCLEPLGLDIARTTWSWGAGIGHAGAVDQLAGLDHLVRERALRPGARVALVGIGGGFNWTCLIAVVTDHPPAGPGPAG